MLSAETALDLLDDEAARAACCCARRRSWRAPWRPRRRPGPGARSRRWPAEARSGLAGKVAHLGGPGAGARGAAEAPTTTGGWEGVTSAVVAGAHGLHARPAAAVVRAAAGLDAEVRVRNLTTGARARAGAAA